MSLENFYSQYSFHISIECEWSDMDAFQHINNKVYFKYFENVRIAYLEKAKILSSHIQPVLSETSCKFIKPLHYPEKIIIGANVSHIFGYKALMNYGIYSEDKQCTVAVGTSSIVSFDNKKKTKTNIPKEWIQSIQRISPMVLLTAPD